MPFMLLPALLLSLSGTAPKAAVPPGPAAITTENQGTAAITVQLSAAPARHSFEGALAILDPVRGIPGKFRAAAHDGVEVLPISADGTAEFIGILPGLYQLHLVDALGMPFLQGPEAVFASAVEGATATYRVETQRLYLLEGSVVESSVGDPIPGASIRIDPREELTAAPLQRVFTDDEGTFRALTARTEVVVIDAEYYRSVNAKFGAVETAGTIKMKPMLKLRSVHIDRDAGSKHPDAEKVKLRHLPPVPAGSDQPSLVGEDGEGGAVRFGSLPHRRLLLEWPLEPGGGDYRGVRWLHEFTPRRGGGSQTIALPKVELRPDALPTAVGFLTRWNVDCATLVNRRLLLMTDPRWDRPHSGLTNRLPSLPADAPTPEWTLHCGSRDQESPGGSYQLRWRGEGNDPAATGSTGLLREVRANDVLGSTAIVFDGDWLGCGRVTAEPQGTVLVPAIGGGDLYGSSTALRGDVVRQSVSEAPDAEVSLRLPEVGEVASLDLRFLEGGSPARGLAVHVVQKDAVITGEVLDLLGETPLVTDASGTVYLRNFVPGEYELRVDASRSRAPLPLGAAVVVLKPGSNEPQTIVIP